jgi:hypothetical protein
MYTNYITFTVEAKGAIPFLFHTVDLDEYTFFTPIEEMTDEEILELCLEDFEANTGEYVDPADVTDFDYNIVKGGV